MAARLAANESVTTTEFTQTRATPFNSLTPRQFAAIAIPAILVYACLTYANTLSNEFVWDDASSILLHQHVQDPQKVGQLFLEDQHAFGRGLGTFYRPLLSVSFMIDFVITRWAQGIDSGATASELQRELSPFLFHVTNLLWHVAATVLLFGILVRFRAPREACAIVPLVYAIHPLQTEAVTYISGRADSMAAAFVFAALLFATARSMKPVVAVTLSLLCFAGGLLSKESAMIYPVLLVAAVLCVPDTDSDRSSPRARWIPLAGAVLLLAIYIGLRATILDFPSDSTAPTTGFGQRVVETLQALTLYIGLIFAPLGLHMERSLSGDSPILAVPGALFLIGSVGLAVWAYRRDRKRLTFAIAWFIVTWLPISGIFPLNAPMAEHWLYVPLAGFVWAVAELIVPFVHQRPIPGAIAATVTAAWTIALVAISVDRNRDWRDNESIFTATLFHNSESLRVRYNLAVTYEDLTDNAIGATREFERFLQDYGTLETADPAGFAFYKQTALEADVSLGGLYFQRGLIRQAADRYGHALESVGAESLTPEAAALAAEASLGLGRCFQAAGQPQEAEPHFARAVQLRPDMAPLVEQIRSGRPS